MTEPRAYKGKLSDFKPDEHNLNQHTQRGRGMVENSQRLRGFGRPGFAAKDKTMLGGNLSIMEVAADIELGDGEVFVVETDGNIPIVHVRRDLDPDTEAAKLLAAEDNQSALVSIDFDPEVFAAEIAAGVDFSGIFTDDETERYSNQIPTTEKWGEAFGRMPDGEKSSYQQMTFTLHNEQAEQVKSALEIARNMGEFDTENENRNGNSLSRICEVFLTHYGKS
jgi:hypothetical protein